MVDGDVLVLRGQLIDNIAMMVDRDPSQQYFIGESTFKRLPRAVDRAFIESHIQIGYIGQQLLEWENLEPSDYPSGESRLRVYQTLLDGIRVRHQSQWYGTSPTTTVRKKTSESLRRLLMRYEAHLGNGNVRTQLLMLVFVIDGVQQFDAHILQSKTVARTSQGYLVCTPIETRVGDSVAIFEGGKVPFVVHRDEESGTNRLRGDCYVSGMMKGELWSEENCYEIRIV